MYGCRFSCDLSGSRYNQQVVHSKARANERYSSFPVDAKRYDDMDILREELESLPKTLTYKILELQRCPKCKKEFTEHPALSREDDETEICPECGVREAIEAYQKATQK